MTADNWWVIVIKGQWHQHYITFSGGQNLYFVFGLQYYTVPSNQSHKQSQLSPWNLQRAFSLRSSILMASSKRLVHKLSCWITESRMCNHDMIVQSRPTWEHSVIPSGSDCALLRGFATHIMSTQQSRLMKSKSWRILWGLWVLSQYPFTHRQAIPYTWAEHYTSTCGLLLLWQATTSYQKIQTWTFVLS